MKQKSFIYDYWLLSIVFVLIAIGLTMVASASMVISDQQFHTPFHFLSHQIAYIIVAICLAVVVSKLQLKFWKNISSYLILATIFLLFVVLIPGIGRHVNGSIRWIGFGPFALQVSELAKFSIVIFLAGYLVRRQTEVEINFSGFLKPMTLLLIVTFLLLLEPDFGATTVIMATAMGMLFLAGARLRAFVVLLAGVVAVLALLAIASPYRLVRLTTFLHPWTNQFKSGYQLTQSLIAFGRGGIFGVGLGNSIQKLFYLPEAHTDFLFAVLAEEFGLIGEIIVLSLFVALIGRIFFIGRMARKIGKNFAAYIAYGFALWLGFQVFVNIGVNSGMLPTKGLTLPFMSYGGSSMLLNCMAIAIVLRIYHETKTS